MIFCKITQKMQNKGPKKGKIGPQKALINKTRLGGALRAPPNLVFAVVFLSFSFGDFSGVAIEIKVPSNDM